MYYALGLAILNSLIKNRARSLALKRELLQIRDSISALFPGE